MMRRIRSVVGLALCTVGALLALGVPAGAQQLKKTEGKKIKGKGKKRCDIKYKK